MNKDGWGMKYSLLMLLAGESGMTELTHLSNPDLGDGEVYGSAGWSCHL